ncbi:MAG: hypothetical protein ACOZDY_18560 [Pseudomonadota bacterium]
MPSRVIREALLESDRWLSLAHPVERLAYVALLLRVDDLGTYDASDGQLVRTWRDVCNVKGRDDALKILNGLVDADLVRTYDVDGKRFIYIPRFKQRFRARTFLRPPPPDSLLHDEPDVLENIRQIKERTAQMPDTRPTGDGHMPDECPARAPVVGVGVVVGVVKPESARKRAPTAFSGPETIPEDWRQACVETRSDLNPAEVYAGFCEYWTEGEGAGKRRKNWRHAWLNWVRRERSRPGNGIGRRGAFDVDLQQKNYSTDLPTGSDR